MMNFLTENWFQIATTLGLAIGWIADRRKRRLEVGEVQGNVFDQMQKSYESYIEHHQQQQKTMLAENDKLFKRLSEIEQTLVTEQEERERDLKVAEQERDKLLDRIKEFEGKVAQYEITVKTLKDQIEEYKKELALYKEH